MNQFLEWINVVSPGVITGLFSLLAFMFQRKEARSKKNSERMDQIANHMELISEMIEKNYEIISWNMESIQEVSNDLADLKSLTQANAEGTKDTLRYMLQRQHAQYMVTGYISSHQLDEFNEQFETYASLGGNGTAAGWKREIETLPVRDDLPILNPYLEIYKEKILEERGELY